MMKRKLYGAEINGKFKMFYVPLNEGKDFIKSQQEYEEGLITLDAFLKKFSKYLLEDNKTYSLTEKSNHREFIYVTDEGEILYGVSLKDFPLTKIAVEVKDGIAALEMFYLGVGDNVKVKMNRSALKRLLEMLIIAEELIMD